MFSCFRCYLHAITTTKFIYFLFLNFLLITFFSDAGLAQHKHNKKAFYFLKNKLDVGASGGLSLNSFATAQPQAGFNTGAAAGLSINYKFFRGLGVQLEANFLQQGGQLISFKDDTRYGLPESFETKNVKNSSYILNSIEIPLLLNYTFKLKQSWKPAIYTG